MYVVNGFNKQDIEGKLKNRVSFEVNGLRGNFMDAIRFVETTIESQGLRCRIETDLKSSVAAGGVAGVVGGIISAPATITAGIAGIGFGIGHKLLTRNPDYLIKKDYVNFKLTVEYKK